MNVYSTLNLAIVCVQQHRVCGQTSISADPRARQDFPGSGAVRVQLQILSSFSPKLGVKRTLMRALNLSCANFYIESTRTFCRR